MANFFIVLTLLVFVHELGHYLAARLCRVKVLAFSIGFGPKIVGFFDRHGTEWKLAWLPLGGFVKMLGEMLPVPREKQRSLDGSINKADLPFAFHKKPVWQRFIIVAAGPLANFLFAFFLLVAMNLGFGIASEPKKSKSSGSVAIEQVMKSSAAEFAGMKVGDQILSMNKLAVQSPNDVIDFMKNANGDKITIGVLRDGKKVTLSVRPNPGESVNGKATYRLGVSFRPLGGAVVFTPTSFTGAVVHGFDQTINLTVQTLDGFKRIFTGQISLNQLGGPVMIAKMSGDVGVAGVYAFFSFMVMLSLNLAIINLFPIPVLDGGHLVLLAIEQVFRKPLPQLLQQGMMMVGMAFLVMLMLAVTVKDIWQLFLQ
ncbi:MAG: RIP metalloprotease RseP, partial [Hydrotalea sp.]|nr:RIP metalloprotease RseP [Hydrotalea sp.]